MIAVPISEISRTRCGPMRSVQRPARLLPSTEPMPEHSSTHEMVAPPADGAATTGR